MSREEYIEYVQRGDLMPIAYEYWQLHRKPEYDDLDFRGFIHHYSDYFENSNFSGGDGGMKKMLKYFDDKLSILKLYDKPNGNLIKTY